MAERIHRVLIIDADLTTEESLRPTLAHYGYTTQASTSSNEGQEIALNQPPSIILLAVNLPDANGLDLFHWLRKRPTTLHIPVIFIAAYGESKLQKQLLQAGVDDFVTKPFDADLLALRIRNAVQRTEREGLTHPRTGLPTGRLLDERVKALAATTNWYKIELELANFNAFVSSHGFMSGEEVITFTINLVTDVVRHVGTTEDFIGQRGDAQLVIIAAASHGEAIKQAIEQRFNEEVQAFYTFIERDQGYVEIDDGNSGIETKPLMNAQLTVTRG